MAITFPITGVSNTFSASRSPSFTLGTSPLENDIICAFVSSTTSATTTDVSGWVNVLGANAEVDPGDGSMTAMMGYHRVTNAEDTADTVTWTLTNLWDATETGAITVTVMRGVATSGELVGSVSRSDSGLASSWVIETVTPTADCQIMAGVASDGTQTQTTPGTHTNRASTSTTQSNYLYSDNDLGINGTPTGTTNVTPSGGDEYVSIVACFKPADDSRPARFATTSLQAVNRAGSW